ncbi:MAG: acyl-CoA dehydrogenase family protein [Kordiimonadaceae bacterium]|nr:acyl-CoA dehydrogenase family protein [Kordiimonadaceae bacterium]
MMDFNDTEEEATFRKRVTDWLTDNAKPLTVGNQLIGLDPSDKEGLKRAVEWQAKKMDAGFAAITVLKSAGGEGGSHIQEAIYRQEEASYDTPSGVYEIGLGMCVPTLIEYGTDDHRERYVKKAYRGEEIWCQLFSEPSGGSDIAGLRTKAVRDGNDWVINGQKVWTSGAHFCDFGILLVRTDASVPKHKGLTMFIVDMKTPGVEVRPIRTIAGTAEFNEVFFENVRIADSDRLGDVGGGWGVAISTLMKERLQAGLGMGFLNSKEILNIARSTKIGEIPASEDARVRQRLADFWVNEQALSLLLLRAQTALSKGGIPGPEQSVNKVVEAYQSQQASYFAMDLLGEEGALQSGELGEVWSSVERTWYWATGMRIAGGTDEILRNIIAERVLGLPGDPRPDKGKPFNELSA